MKKARDFKLRDQFGKIHALSSYLGKWVLLYFYPRDNTPGCTKEACGISDLFAEYKKRKVVVLGVSGDSVESHKKFADKYKLPFSLLADRNKKVLKLYGVSRRTSFLINPKGKIEKEYKNVKPLEHAREVLDDIKMFERR